VTPQDIEEQIAKQRELLEQDLLQKEKWLKMKMEILLAESSLTTNNFRAGFMHSYRADCHVDLSAPDLETAIRISAGFQLLSLVKVTGSFSVFTPKKSIVPSDEKDNTITDIMPYLYMISGLREYLEDKVLHFYREIAGYTVEYRIKVKHDPSTCRDYKITYDRFGNAHKKYCRIINNSGYFHESTKFWSPEDNPNRFILWSYLGDI